MARSRLIGTLFFFSGGVALAFEVVWAKQLGLVLGCGIAAVAYVVSLFMAGLAGGTALGGRIAGRLQRPVAVYGAAELLLAGLAAVAVLVLPSLGATTSAAGAWLAAAALILPCAALMGLSLPLLVRDSSGRLGAAVGWLYAANTAGAVAGTLLAGFILVGRLGLRASGLLASTAGVAVGVAALVVGLRSKPLATTTPGRGSARGGARRWLLLAGLAGLASLAEEVLWTRALVPHLNSSTYAFSAILATFLVGLAAGAALAGRALARGARPVPLLAATQVGAGLLVLCSPELMDLAEAVVTGYGGVRRVTGTAAWGGTLLVTFSRCALSILPPTLLAGFALPLLADLFGEGGRPPHGGGSEGALDRGAATGRVVAWNTVLAIVGATGAHLVLLPGLGVGGGLQVTAGLHAVVAAVALLRWRPVWLVAPAVLLLAAAARPPARPFLGRLAAPHRLVYVQEGVQDTVAVVELTTPGVAGARQILSNGIAYAGDTPGGKRYMRLLGHLPALQAARQGRALVICVGTGMTAAAVARHPFRRVDLVDISSAVLMTLPLFERSNDGVARDRRVRLHLADGRRFLAGSPSGSYDLVTLEPPPPRAAGAAALYSREFYLAVRRVLTPGAALAQWLPLHGLTADELGLLTRTFLDVFPDGELVRISHQEAALLATRGPGATPEERAARAARPDVAEHLGELGVADPESLPRAGGEALRRALGPGPLVTDDHLRIEFFGSGLPGEGPAEGTARWRFLREIGLGPR